jgi:hypothetical protein
MAEKEGYYKSKEILKFLIISLLFLIILISVYSVFFYTRVCKDKQCFSSALIKCSRVVWINDAEEATWIYTIKGVFEDSCEVEVELSIVKKGGAEMAGAEGKSMTCYLPLETFASPEQDLGRCNGLLKEELQDLLIKRLHSYILENLGQVNEELTKAV